MKKLIFLFCITLGLAQNNGIRSLNGSLNNSQRLAIDTTTSATFRWATSNGVHTLYLPYRIVNPSSGSFKWNVSGQTAKYDSLRLIAGSNVSLTQSGNTVTIATSGGGSVGNADSLGGLPASDYVLVSDSASRYVTKSSRQVIDSSKWWTQPQYFRDSVFIGTQSPSTNELLSISSNTDADIKLWTASTGDPSSVNMQRSRGTLSSPSNINSGDVVAQFRGFGYKDGFKELANITLGSQASDTTGGIFFYTRNSTGLSQRWEMSYAGNILPTANNTYSFGSDGFRPDTIWGITGRYYTDLVVGASDPSPTPAFSEKLRVNDAILGLYTINVLTNSTTTHPVFHVMRSRSGLTTLQSGDVIGSIAATGYDGTSFDSDESAWMSFGSAGTFTPTSKPTRIMFATANTGDSIGTNRHQIEPSGELIPSAGDNTNSIGNATNRYAGIYGINGQFGGRVVGTDIRVTDSIVGVSINATGLMTIGSGGTALAHQISSSSANALTLYRNITSVGAASGLNFAGNQTSGAQVTYATIQGLLQSPSNSLQSGGLVIATRKSATEIKALMIDSLQNVFLQTQNTSTNSDTRFNIRSNVTGLYAIAVLPSSSATKQFSVDTVGNTIAKKVTADSTTILGKVNFSGITTDSTTCQRGQLYLEASTGRIKWKY